MFNAACNREPGVISQDNGCTWAVELGLLPEVYALKMCLFLLLLSGIYNPYEFESPHSGGSEVTHKDAPQSVGLLWTSDQPVAETST
jgi:hypothetical protein